MKTNIWKIAACVSVVSASTVWGVEMPFVAGFEDVGLPPGRQFNNGGPVPGTAPIVSSGVAFGNAFNADFDWRGTAVSAVSNTTDGTFANQYAAFPGSAASGGKYGVYYWSEYAINTLGFTPNYIDLPAGTRPLSVKATNTTYAAITMRDGDGFGFAKKFGGTTGNDADFFKAVFTGYAGPAGTGGVTGSVEFYLADFRPSDNAQDYIVGDWRTVDLTGLGAARSIYIGFVSSDVGFFGINTPTYVAIDDLTVIPEPAALGLLAPAALLLGRRR